MRPEYVHEATRLLQKSIIFVETDDVVLEDTLDKSILQSQTGTSIAPPPVTLHEDQGKGKEEAVEDEIIEEDEVGERMEEEPAVEEKDAGDVEGSVDSAVPPSSVSAPTKSRKRKRKSEKKAKKSEKKAKKEITITFEKYQQISNLLVMLLRKREETEGETFRGLTQRECVDLYLTETKAETVEDIEVR